MRTSATIHEAQIAVIICHATKRGFQIWLLSRGAKPEEFRHVPVERYRELFLIAAAFLTSCDSQQSPPKAFAPLPALHISE